MAKTPDGAQSKTFAFSNFEFLYEIILVSEWYKLSSKMIFHTLHCLIEKYEKDQVLLVSMKRNSLYIYF